MIYSNHLLIIDDNQGGCTGLTTQLQQLGYTVTVIDNPAQVDHVFVETQPDLIFFKATLPLQAATVELVQGFKADHERALVPLLALIDQTDPTYLEQLFAAGVDDCLLEPIPPLLLKARINHYLRYRQLHTHSQAELREMEKLADDLKHVVLPLAVALSTEKDPDQLLEKILLEARAICSADAGLLYLRTEDDLLRLAIRHSVPLSAKQDDDDDGDKKGFSPPLRLYDQQSGAPNYSNVATCTAINNYSINIPDVYRSAEFDFSGTKSFDQLHNYRTTSILAIPLNDEVDEVIGIFELINAKEPTSGQVIAFDAYHQRVVESLASLAMVALNYQRLLIERDDTLAALQARMAELHTIHQIGQTISSTVDLDQTLTYILTSIQAIVPFDAAEICLQEKNNNNNNNNKMVCCLAYPDPTKDLEPGQPAPDLPRYTLESGYLDYLSRQEQGVLLTQAADFDQIQPEVKRTWSAMNPASYLGVLLKAKNQTVGVIELVCRQPQSFSRDNLQLVESIALQASIAIQNAQEVQARERTLKQTIQKLRIQIDEGKQQAEVEKIVSSDYFQSLSEKAKLIRSRSKRNKQ